MPKKATVLPGSSLKSAWLEVSLGTLMEGAEVDEAGVELSKVGRTTACALLIPASDTLETTVALGRALGFCEIRLF